MFKWFKKGESEGDVTAPRGIREIDASADLTDLLGQDTVMIFKHSTACPVSWAAHLQVTKFLKDHPAFPLYMVSVIQQRPASNQIAEQTGVRHQSPQIILLRHGKVAAAISHGQITAGELHQLIAD